MSGDARFWVNIEKPDGNHIEIEYEGDPKQLEQITELIEESVREIDEEEIETPQDHGGEKDTQYGEEKSEST